MKKAETINTRNANAKVDLPLEFILSLICFSISLFSL